MQKYICLSILILSLGNRSLMGQTEAEGGWHQLTDQQGMQIHERLHEKGREYKVVTDLNAPADQVIRFLSDFTNYQHFLVYFERTELLARISASEFYGYAVMMPAGTTTRTDVVLHFQLKDLPGGSWVGRASAEPDYVPLRSGMTRDSALEAMWAVQNLGKTCRYTYHYFMSNEGLTPVYAQNLAQTNLENIRRLKALLEPAGSEAAH